MDESDPVEGARTGRTQWAVDRSLWDNNDATLTARAVVRVAAGAVWLGVACRVADPSAIVVGVVMLFGGCVSLLHSQRRFMEQAIATQADRRPRAAAGLAWFFPYPRHVHANAVGFLEVSTAYIATIWTGWLVGTFAADPTANLLAIVALSAIYGSMMTNFQAHAVWHIHPDSLYEPTAQDLVLRRFYRFYGVLTVPLVAAAIFPGWGSDPLIQAMALLGPGLAVGQGLGASLLLESHVRSQERLAAEVERNSLRRVSGFLHAALRTRIRMLLNAVNQHDTPIEVVRQAHELSLYNRLAESAMERGQLRLAGRVSKMIADLARSLPAWEPLADCVIADMDTEDLDPEDADLVFSAVIDLFTNIAKAGATNPTVSVRFLQAEGGSGEMIEIEVACDCEMGTVPVRPGTSLDRLAREVRDAHQGTFILSEDDDAHYTTITWPPRHTWQRPAAAARSNK